MDGSLPRADPAERPCHGANPSRQVQKVLFESRPDFYVGANLYLPRERSGPSPAVLNVIGNSPEGKATEKVHRRAIAQAQKGFAALAVDAIL